MPNALTNNTNAATTTACNHNVTAVNHHYHVISALVVGFIFGIGLLVSNMVNPAKVIGFLAIFGNWDPSLALVMVAAIGVGVFGFWLLKSRSHTLLGEVIQLPNQRNLDRKLIIGNVLFGVGWGIAGFCPGPALVSAVMGFAPAVVFVLSMCVGMWLFTATSR